MNIRVLSKRDEIPDLKAEEVFLHIAFRPSTKDFFFIISKCPSLKIIQLPPSYHRFMSKSLKEYFVGTNVKLIEGHVWGHRKDLSIYHRVPDLRPRLNRLMDSGRPENEIVTQIVKECKISPQLTNYIIDKEKLK